MKKIKNKKIAKRARIKAKIRSRVKGTEKMPRFSVFKSNQHIYAQLIDDVKGRTIASASDFGSKSGTKSEKTKAVGKTIAEEAAKKKISKVVFDRGGFKYTGRIKLLADAAREAGLKF